MILFLEYYYIAIKCCQEAFMCGIKITYMSYGRLCQCLLFELQNELFLAKKSVISSYIEKKNK